MALTDTDLPKDQLDHVRSEIRAEIQLLNSRLNALLASQSFLVIAYSSVLGSAFGNWRTLFAVILPTILAILGGVLVWEARPSLKAAEEAIAHWRAREEDLVSTHEGFQPFTLAHDEASRNRLKERQRAGNQFARRAPAILLVAWVLFLLLPLVLLIWG